MHPMTKKTSMEMEEQNMKIPAGGAVSLVVDGGALVICSMKQGHTVFLQHAANPLLL